MLLVALLGAQALEFDFEATHEKADTSPEMVSTFIGSYDMHCWQNHCMDKCMSCAEEVQKCRDHFFCPFSPQECFQNVKWSDLAPQEVQVFDCAKDNHCVPHGPASFIEVAMRAPQGQSAAAASKAGVMSPADAVKAAKLHAATKGKAPPAPAASAAPKTETPVLDATMKHLSGDMKRALVSVADHAAFVAKAQDRLHSIGARLDKMYKIKHPTAADSAEVMGLIREMSLIHDAQEQQFNEFSQEGISSLLETGSPEPSRLYYLLSKLADYHAPVEAVEGMLSHVMGIKTFNPISHIEEEFNGNTDFHHVDAHTDAKPADGSGDAAGADAAGADAAGADAASAGEAAPEEPQGKTPSTTESPEQRAAAEEEKAKEAEQRAAAEVNEDEKKYWADNEESSIDQLNHYDPKTDKDLKKMRKTFQDMRDEMDDVDYAIEGNTTGMDDLQRTQHIMERATPQGPLPDSFAQASSFAEVGKAKAKFSLAEVEHAAGKVASAAAQLTGRVEASAVKGFAAADRALGVDVDPDGHLRLHK